jgi:hypothetical protein
LRLEFNGTTLAFGDEPHQMLKIILHFSKHCSCNLQGESVMVGCLWHQGESVMVGCLWQSYIGQAVGEELDFMVLIGEAEERTAIQWKISTWLRKRSDEFFFHLH